MGYRREEWWFLPSLFCSCFLPRCAKCFSGSFFSVVAVGVGTEVDTGAAASVVVGAGSEGLAEAVPEAAAPAEDGS